MIKSYFKIALRNLFKNKTHTLLNVFGLAIGIACCILIMLYVQDELSFDKFHSKHDRIFRVIEKRQNPDGSKSIVPMTNGLIGKIAKEQLPQVEQTLIIIGRSATGRFTVQNSENKYYSGDHIFTSQNFFDVFDFKLIEGDKTTALADPNSVLITRTAKEKYFGEQDALGKVLTIEDRGDVRIAGILEDPPNNSHLSFDLVFPIQSLFADDEWREWINSWRSKWITTYVLLKPGYNEESIRAGFKQLGVEHFDEKEKNRVISLQRMDDIHFLSGEMQDDYLNANSGEESYIYILSIIAFFILLIACINFMNLSTAKSFDRAKEVGLRKVMGAFRANILKQFLGESLIISLISLLLSIVIIELLFPLFNTLTGKSISANHLENWPYVLSIILLSVLVGIISGSYPAFYISKFQPVKVLKGIQKTNKGEYSFRQILVVIQFALSIIMIVSTVLVYQQLQFIQNKRLGFQKDNMIVVDINSGESRRSFRAIKSEMLNHPSVVNVTTTSRVPGEWKNLPQIKIQASGSETITQPYHITVDEDFLRTYSVELIDGRNFSESMGTDSASVILNETAAKLFGWDEAVGKTIYNPDENYTATVIGVVKDFHIESLHQQIPPVILGYLKNPFMPIDYYSIKTNNVDFSGVLSHLRTVHEKFDKVTPFEYNFLDERIKDFYIADQRMGSLFGIAALLSILIACLGLFALSSFMTKVRTKEIGIRKILGSTVREIVLLLSKDFGKWVIIANFIAWPVAYFAINKWLEDFAYRIDITIWAFVFTGSVSLAIAFITVGFHAVKAALANPVKSLRYE